MKFSYIMKCSCIAIRGTGRTQAYQNKGCALLTEFQRSIYSNRTATSILLSNDPIIAHYWYQYSRISESGLAYFQYIASSTTKFHATGDTPWSMWP